MTTHSIPARRESVHGYFSRDLDPILTIDPGDTVVYQTLDAGWHPDRDPDTGEWDWRKRIDWHDPENDIGHALNGPIAIRGTEAGSTLEISIDDVRPGTWGWTVAGGWESDLNDRLGVSDEPGTGITWNIDAETGTATSNGRPDIALRPFMGVMGMPPDEPGRNPTAPPRSCGGNMDCKELVAGTKLYLPITIPGCLFSVGDGHGVQGDGEVSGVAIECAMDRVELTFGLHPDLRIDNPRVWTPNAWITLGFDEDLDNAMVAAVDGMLGLMGELHGLNRKDALALASLLVDLRITQVVNGVRGVHAVLPHDAIRIEPASSADAEAANL